MIHRSVSGRPRARRPGVPGAAEVAGTDNRPQPGTATWPPAGTFPRPWTRSLIHVKQSHGRFLEGGIRVPAMERQFRPAPWRLCWRSVVPCSLIRLEPGPPVPDRRARCNPGRQRTPDRDPVNRLVCRGELWGEECLPHPFPSPHPVGRFQCRFASASGSTRRGLCFSESLQHSWARAGDLSGAV